MKEKLSKRYKTRLRINWKKQFLTLNEKMERLDKGLVAKIDKRLQKYLAKSQPNSNTRKIAKTQRASSANKSPS